MRGLVSDQGAATDRAHNESSGGLARLSDRQTSGHARPARREEPTINNQRPTKDNLPHRPKANERNIVNLLVACGELADLLEDGPADIRGRALRFGHALQKAAVVLR